VYRRVRGSFSDRGGAGANRVRFSGRLGGRALRRGSYRLVAVATDPAGNHSTVKYARFAIV
jgi:hypothetical protein